ncbi:hypothetical protein B5P45_05720 [Phyllobacterium zundukense]|uniref:glycerophosphodiester phosphodiesterase n=2 Tax=Phyllobacterium zundukense TaxID=1867719 RepID=A0A2N9W2Q6_9HYPH|nr:hypothetical protein B5P45_05720 [Phyllobacterium zundukense]
MISACNGSDSAPKSDVSDSTFADKSDQPKPTNTKLQDLGPIVSPVPEVDPRAVAPQAVQAGTRPYFLVDSMSDGPLKTKLKSCADGPFKRTDFAIAHRGAPLEFPEHTKEGYEAAIRMGAGILECDVTLTKDNQLVCRHQECDLALTTDVLSNLELAAKCSIPFTPAQSTKKASVSCCTYDFTLDEFLTLKGKLAGSNPDATKPTEYLRNVSDKRTGLYSRGTVMSHAQSIALFDAAGVKMTPELKDVRLAPGSTRENFIKQLIKEYRDAKIDPSRVYIQAKKLDDVLYLAANERDFAKGASYLWPLPSSVTDDRLADLYKQGVRTISSAWENLTDIDKTTKKPIPSKAALAARKARFELVGWTMENDYWLTKNGDDVYEMLDVLAKDVGVKGVFFDWVGTTSYYASCMGLK